jgi:hypothetical protein
MLGMDHQIRAFLDASGDCNSKRATASNYVWVNGTLRQKDYGQLKVQDKAPVRRDLAKMTGLSRAKMAPDLVLPA